MKAHPILLPAKEPCPQQRTAQQIGRRLIGAGPKILPRCCSRACVPYALAFTIGLLVEHFAQPRLAWSLLVSVIGIVAWFLAGLGRRPAWQFGYVCLILAGLSAAHLHLWLSDEGPEDICRLTDERPRPIQVRGIIEQEPINVQQSAQDELRTQPAGSVFGLSSGLRTRKDDDGWKPARGKADLSVSAPMEDIHRGDEVEIVGRLQAFSPPMNPGEADRTTRAYARGIHSQITVVKVAQAVTRLSAGSGWSPGRKLDQLRGLAMRQLSVTCRPIKSAWRALFSWARTPLCHRMTGPAM